MWRVPVVQTQLIRRGLLLEYITLGWNIVGVIIVLAAAYIARSVALAGFGLDSLIEFFASMIVVWQLLGVNQHRERLALLLIVAANGVWQVALCVWQPGLSRGMPWPARKTLLADMVPALVYRRAYGFERMMDNLGTIAGPLLMLGLVTLVVVHLASGLSVIPGLLATLLILYTICHIPHARSREHLPLRLRVHPLLHGQQ